MQRSARLRPHRLGPKVLYKRSCCCPPALASQGKKEEEKEEGDREISSTVAEAGSSLQELPWRLLQDLRVPAEDGQGNPPGSLLGDASALHPTSDIPRGQAGGRDAVLVREDPVPPR